MGTQESVAPAVQSILDAARDRDAPDRTLAVEPRSLQVAFDCAESEDRKSLHAVWSVALGWYHPLTTGRSSVPRIAQ